jgi:lipid-binding SYLF domain-containing protein
LAPEPTFDLDAQILSYSRTKGVFAGLELKGTVIKQDPMTTTRLSMVKTSGPRIS